MKFFQPNSLFFFFFSLLSFCIIHWTHFLFECIFHIKSITLSYIFQSRISFMFCFCHLPLIQLCRLKFKTLVIFSSIAHLHCAPHFRNRKYELLKSIFLESRRSSIYAVQFVFVSELDWKCFSLSFFHSTNSRFFFVFSTR